MQSKVEATVKSIKERIGAVEKEGTKLSETDTRQGLINPMFSALGWDFGDFTSVKSELRHKNYNDPVDYAFFSSKNKSKPVLLLEAKTLGTNLNDPKIVKQLCMYLGEMGVQWGVLSDGNKYVMYNSKGGNSFEDQKFLTLTIKDVDTEDGMPLNEFSEKLVALLSRECLENDDIQATYEEHMIDSQIQEAMQSLLSTPFDTLAQAIRNEFKVDRVKTNDNLKISKKRIIEYLENLSDEEGQLPISFTDNDTNTRSEEVMIEAANSTESNEDKLHVKERTAAKRISIQDLLTDGLIHEGDNWRLQNKGETFWARVTGNGELEVNGQTYSNPSRAGTVVTSRPCAGWDYWHFKTTDGEWKKIENLRAIYRESHGIRAMKRTTRSTDTSPEEKKTA